MKKKSKLDDSKNVLYAVLRLSTDINVTNPFTGEEESVKLGGVAGYIPVFSSIDEAKESSQKGKYQILPLQQPD